LFAKGENQLTSFPVANTLQVRITSWQQVGETCLMDFGHFGRGTAWLISLLEIINNYHQFN